MITPSDTKQIKPWSLKTLILVCIIPVFIGASAAGILFNYWMARENAQKRLDDHILQHRMELHIIAQMPTLPMLIRDMQLGLLEKADQEKKQTQLFISEYLKSIQPDFKHILSLIDLQGREILRIENGLSVGVHSDRATPQQVSRLAAIQPDQDIALPRIRLADLKGNEVEDLFPVFEPGTKKLQAGLVYVYALPIPELMATLHQNLYFNVFLAIASVLITIVITYLILELNIKPLRHLTALVQNMIEGDLSNPVKLKGSGETRILATSFETMRRQLKEQIELLTDNAAKFKLSLADVKRTQAQLQVERDYSAGIIAGSPNLICGIDAQGLITFINTAGLRISGYQNGELLKRDFCKTFFPQESNCLVDSLFQASASSEIYNLEQTMTSKSGAPRTLLWSSFRRRDDEGQVSEVVLIGTDVTERQQAEQDLRKFRTISERSNYGSAIYDLQGRFTYINPAYAAMHGYQSSELIGRHQTIFYGSKFVHEHQLLQQRLMHQGHLAAEEINHVRRDGSVFPLLLNSTLVYDAQGRPQFSSETAMDLTEKKVLEEQLQIRQRMDSLGTLAGGIAHDFNNLLSGIMGYLDLLHLRSENFSAKQKRYLSHLNESVSRAAELIQQFQSLSQGNVSIKRHVDVHQIVREVFNILKETTDRLIQKQNLITADLFHVRANHTELTQVFLNLGVNAKEAIEAKGVTADDYIRVSAQNVLISETKPRTLTGGKYVHITFVDSGCGMTEEIKAKAFDPLFSSKKKSQRKGQGLGLAMVYNIIKNHDGHISVDSEPGHGTTFHIYLPAVEALKSDAVVRAEMLPGTETILFVDDEAMLRDVVKEGLMQLGYNVWTAGDGVEGLALYLAQQSEIDVVLMDLIMPRMSGDMLLNKLKEIDPQVKVIVCSGHSEGRMSPKVKAQAAGFIAKPLDMRELSSMLRRVLDGGQDDPGAGIGEKAVPHASD